ncbi:MAG: tetratricopeptide repeat protein [Candidatus Omnitrophota bacterium]
MGQKNSLWVLFLVLLGVILYWNSLRTPFIWDEDFLILGDLRVHNASLGDEIFGKSFLPSSEGFSRFYRPLITLSLRTDYLLWKKNPFGYHLTNLLLHLFNTLLVYGLLLRILKKPPLAFLGAFLFLAHPAHVEAVTYIPGRVDLIPFFFVLASFHLYLLGRSGRKFWPYLLSVFCYGGALLSKEMAAFFPAVILGHLLLVERKKEKLRLAEGVLLLGMFFVFLGWAFFRQLVSVQIPLKTLLDIPRLPIRLLTIPKLLFAYLKMWFFPWPTHMEHMISYKALSVYQLVLEWALLFLIVIWILIRFRKPEERFWFLWIFVMLLPVLQIFPIYLGSFQLFVSEHFLYFASVGMIMLLALRFGGFLVNEEGLLRENKGLLFFGTVLILFSSLVIWRNGEYRDRIVFFEQTVRFAPWSSRAYNQLGLAYKNAGYPEEAEAAFQKALLIEPTKVAPYVNLGSIDYDHGRIEEAEARYLIALKKMPRDSILLHNMGVLRNSQKRWREAIPYFEQALIGANWPANMETYVELSHAHWELGEKEKALQLVEEGLKKDPSHEHLLEVKAWIEEKLGKGVNGKFNNK